MIYKRCSYCGARVPEGTTCQCEQRHRARNDKRVDGIRAMYHSRKWEAARDLALKRYSYVDLYALHKYGRLAPATQVHHIEPVLERPDLFLAASNHIPVSDASHHEIHQRYNAGEADEVKKELHEYLAEGLRTPGGPEKVVTK